MSLSIFGDEGEKESCGKCCDKHHRTAHHECGIKQYPHAVLGDRMEAT